MVAGASVTANTTEYRTQDLVLASKMSESDGGEDLPIVLRLRQGNPGGSSTVGMNLGCLEHQAQAAREIPAASKYRQRDRITWCGENVAHMFYSSLHIQAFDG